MKMIKFQLYRYRAVFIAGRCLKKPTVMQEKYFSFSFPRASDLYFIVDTAERRAEYRENASVENALCVPADPHGERERVA